MVVLVVTGFFAAVLALWGIDRALKARVRSRRMRTMSDRLTAATTRAEEQQQRRQAAARESKALTSVIPAIKRPPIRVPGVPEHDAAKPKADRERPGDHPVHSADRAERR